MKTLYNDQNFLCNQYLNYFRKAFEIKSAFNRAQVNEAIANPLPIRNKII